MKWPTQFTFGKFRRQRQIKDVLNKIKFQEEERIRDERDAQIEEEQNMSNYFQDIIYFKDGTVLEVNYANNYADDVIISYYLDDDLEESFLKAPINAIKYISLGRENRLTKDVNLGFKDITEKQCKKKDKEVEGKSSRLEDIE